MGEETLLKQFAAQFAHGPDNADNTDAAAAAQGADSTATRIGRCRSIARNLSSTNNS